MVTGNEEGGGVKEGSRSLKHEVSAANTVMKCFNPRRFFVLCVIVFDICSCCYHAEVIHSKAFFCFPFCYRMFHRLDVRVILFAVGAKELNMSHIFVCTWTRQKKTTQMRETFVSWSALSGSASLF